MIWVWTIWGTIPVTMPHHPGCSEASSVLAKLWPLTAHTSMITISMMVSKPMKNEEQSARSSSQLIYAERMKLDTGWQFVYKILLIDSLWLNDRVSYSGSLAIVSSHNTAEYRTEKRVKVGIIPIPGYNSNFSYDIKRRTQHDQKRGCNTCWINLGHI